MRERSVGDLDSSQEKGVQVLDKVRVIPSF